MVEIKLSCQNPVAKSTAVQTSAIAATASTSLSSVRGLRIDCVVARARLRSRGCSDIVISGQCRARLTLLRRSQARIRQSKALEVFALLLLGRRPCVIRVAVYD